MEDGEAIGTALDLGRPVIRGEDYRVPVAVRPVFEEVTGIVDDFCRRRLDDEYAQLAVALTAKLARKRPSPLLRGDRRIWASAVVYALGRVNFLSDPSQTPHLATEQLARLLGVKQATMAAKGRVVMDLLGLDHFDTEFCLPSRLASHPTAWWIAIDGLLYDARILPPQIQAELGRRRLIPGILAPPGPPTLSRASELESRSPAGASGGQATSSGPWRVPGTTAPARHRQRRRRGRGPGSGAGSCSCDDAGVAPARRSAASPPTQPEQADQSPQNHQPDRPRQPAMITHVGVFPGQGPIPQVAPHTR